MSYITTLVSTITAFFMFISSIFTVGLPVATSPENPQVYDDTVMFLSDFQGSLKDLSGVNRIDNFDALLAGIENENPGLIVGGGDYQTSFLGPIGSAFGISLVRQAVAKKWDYDMQYLFGQGNHDTPKSDCINDSGMYEFDKYIVCLINEDDFPWNQQLDTGVAKKTVEKTVAQLDEALTQLVEAGDTRPVFIVCHLPLHFSRRNNNNDNRYAKLMYDVIEKSADSLNIVYLFGHNHSNTYDDYIGGAVNYFAKGDTMKIGGSGQELTLNFTYTNCGYIGYSGNTDNEVSTSALTVTFITVEGNSLSIRKYSKDGLFMSTAVPAVSALPMAA